ncbi:MAG: hypothetical protein ACLU9N_10800 [Clostridia bacterium]
MTCCFEDLFFENSSAQIVYKGKVLLLEDELHVKNYFRVKIGILSTNSDWRQGIRIATKGTLKSDFGEGKEHIFWEELWEKDIEQYYEIKGVSENGLLWISNCWDLGDGQMQCGMSNAAMIKKEVDKNEYIYHCNDGEFDDDFDDLVFRLKILEGAREE